MEFVAADLMEADEQLFRWLFREFWLPESCTTGRMQR